MQKPVYAIIVLVLLLVLGGIVLTNRNPQPNPSTTLPADTDITAASSDLPSPNSSASAGAASPSVASTTTVTHTESGFSPSTITIKAGETVQFVNNASLAMWVASDPHPSHTGLSGFDSKKGLKTGEIYSFTFTKPGTYGYHDHFDTNHTGIVVVE